MPQWRGESATLATGAGDETIRLWDTATGEEFATLRGHQSAVSALVFSQDGRTVYSAGAEDAIRVWELPDRE